MKLNIKLPDVCLDVPEEEIEAAKIAVSILEKILQTNHYATAIKVIVNDAFKASQSLTEEEIIEL